MSLQGEKMEDELNSCMVWVSCLLAGKHTE